jgi:hypothetical protein
MPKDASPLVLDRVRRYTIGFARAGGDPAALGSGVLLRIGDTRGILTCAHVEAYLQESGTIGVAGFSRPAAFQATTFEIRDAHTLVWGSPPWTKTDPDICFIQLSPDQADGVEARFTFLNADLNLQKYHEPEPSDIVVHAICWLVEEFSGPTMREGGLVRTGLKAVLTPGRIVEKDGHTTTLECLDRNIRDLPASFGGTSGGGLWRVYLRADADGNPEIVDIRLRGIASWEDRAAQPPRIVSQGLGRVAHIIGAVHEREEQ